MALTVALGVAAEFEHHLSLKFRVTGLLSLRSRVWVYVTITVATIWLAPKGNCVPNLARMPASEVNPKP